MVLLIGVLSLHFLLSLSAAPGPAGSISDPHWAESLCVPCGSGSSPGLSGAGGEGCTLRGDPPDPPGWETNASGSPPSKPSPTTWFCCLYPCPWGPPAPSLHLPPCLSPSVSPGPLPSGWPPADSRYRFSWVSKTQPWGELGNAGTPRVLSELSGELSPSPGPHQHCILFPVGHRWVFPPCAPSSPG